MIGTTIILFVAAIIFAVTASLLHARARFRSRRVNELRATWKELLFNVLAGDIRASTLVERVALDRILDDLQSTNYDRLVLDSLTMFQLFFEDEREKRTYLLKFTDILRENGLTTLMTNEQGTVFPETDIGLENFLTDGNIFLLQTPTDSGVNRYVWVAKMRKQNIDTDIFPMEITHGGIKVHQNASAFSMMSEDESPI